MIGGGGTSRDGAPAQGTTLAAGPGPAASYAVAACKQEGVTVLDSPVGPAAATAVAIAAIDIPCEVRPHVPVEGPALAAAVSVGGSCDRGASEGPASTVERAAVEQAGAGCVGGRSGGEGAAAVNAAPPAPDPLLDLVSVDEQRALWGAIQRQNWLAAASASAAASAAARKQQRRQRQSNDGDPSRGKAEQRRRGSGAAPATCKVPAAAPLVPCKRAGDADDGCPAPLMGHKRQAQQQPVQQPWRCSQAACAQMTIDLTAD